MVDKSRGEDIPGPLDIVIAVENSGRQNISKILVFGNALFISDSAAEALAIISTQILISSLML